MPTVLFRLLQRLISLRSWATPALVIAFVFFTSWPLMALFEGADSELIAPENYWWWFLVTTSTVGYGDFYPETTGGHIIGVYVIVGGIATLTTLFTHLATTLETARGRRMSGSASLHVSDHIVMLGYTPGRSERIVDELLADGRHPVVLASWDDVDHHPIPDRGIGFVRGDLMTDDVLRRARLDQAHSVLVDARDDNEALAVAVTVHHVNPALQPVIALRDMSRSEHLRYVDEKIRCVQWHTPQMITEELLDPGITQVYSQLVTHGGGNTYSCQLPASLDRVSYGDCQFALGKRHDATVLAARTDEQLLISPAWSTRLPEGSTLYYICHQRITQDQLVRAVRELDGARS
ncbi:ion transporter [Actinopolyspora erythraea]|uniref:Ion transporter n=1 Tax=Actinopolyspora erythraea TaxID=414996 RepID=A0A099D8F5_9ACTN|nr:ion transporter [Actinopolyspora erythraea]KGI81685.1 ion transporter [Actinopolyspora erythraea]